MANIQINIVENGTTTLATSGCICDRNIDINVDVPTTGGGSTEGVPTDEELVISDNCSYKFSGSGWNWFIEKYKDRITTKDITNSERMFNLNTGLTKIPFTINYKNATNLNLGSTFYGMNITEAPTINLPNATRVNLNNLFQNCNKVKDFNGVFLNEDTFIEQWQNVQNTGEFGNHYLGGIFQGCSSLRTVPTWFYGFRLNPNSTSHIYASYSIYYRMFYDCRVLDEVLNYPVWSCTVPQTKSMIDTPVYQCSRLKDFTFETNEDGSPIVVQWKGQTLDMSSAIGYSTSTTYITPYGISIDKRVTDDASYQALKNDPDWFTTDIAYSRYNHDSALRTIQSLPDTSAYATNNIIKFKGESGSKTDGGAINTLTADEVKIANDKGWTVYVDGSVFEGMVGSGSGIIGGEPS